VEICRHIAALAPSFERFSSLERVNLALSTRFDVLNEVASTRFDVTDAVPGEGRLRGGFEDAAPNAGGAQRSMGRLYE
jgi:hypothetical protein